MLRAKCQICLKTIDLKDWRAHKAQHQRQHQSWRREARERNMGRAHKAKPPADLHKAFDQFKQGYVKPETEQGQG
jgi:hypothetical protein